MAKLMSKKTREIVLTVSVLAAILLFLAFYIIYPLIAVPHLTARADADRFKDPQFKLANDLAYFVQNGLHPDTFAVSSNDNINLAALFFAPDTARVKTKGTVIMLHPDDTDRTSLITFIPALLDSGWQVIIYDQRACGLSGGKYHYAGSYEGDDLEEIIAYLNLHEKLYQPLVAVGFGIGADAAIYAAATEKRVAAVVAVNPYLSTSRWIAARKEKMGALWIPLYKMIYFWWYQKLSSYPFDRTGAGDIKPVEIKTVIFADSKTAATDEMTRIKAVSSPEKLSVESMPTSPDEFVAAVTLLVNNIVRK